MKRRVLGNEHTEVARTLSAQGSRHHRRGALDRAELAYRESLAIRRKTLGIVHPETIESIRDLARVRSAKGDFDQAEQLYRELLARQRAALPGIDPGAADTLYWLGELLLEQDRIAEAESLFRDSLEFGVRLKPYDEQRDVMARRGLAHCLAAKQQYQEAERILLDCYAVVRAGRDETLSLSRSVLQSIVELYETWDRPALVAEYRQILATVRAPNQPDP